MSFEHAVFAVFMSCEMIIRVGRTEGARRRWTAKKRRNRR
jgi:hypothetical protein